MIGAAAAVYARPVEPSAPFVPAGFMPPSGLVTDAFVLEPLGPRHNQADYAAWTSSVPHIQATAGFAGGSWPHEMTLAENLGDLEMHERHFAERSGFTYSVLDPADGDVIGCVYIYPVVSENYDARVLSWVRESRANLDAPLWRAVTEWLASDWPFGSVEHAPRLSS